MKYLVFLFVLMFSSVGCAASWHFPATATYVEYEYVRVPAYKTKVITYHSSHRHVYKKKKVYRKRFKPRNRVIIRNNTHYHYH